MALAVDVANTTQNDVAIYQKIYQEIQQSTQEFHQLDNNEKFKLLIRDPAQRIDEQFKIDPYFKDAVSFWFKIYSFYDSSFAVIHDREYLDLVYASLNFTELKDTPLRQFIQQGLQEQFASEKLMEVKRALTNLSHRDRLSNDFEKDLARKIKAYAPLKIPKTAKGKRDLYQNLAANARLQTGLHDHFREGLQRYFPYQTALQSYFANFKMPPELLAISFVESSFNPKAQSFVGALGIWQFMPKIGRHFLPMSKDIDGRKNPLLATIGALHLLQENYQIFKRWDLAISAYNSGTKHLLLAKKKVQKINQQRQKQYGPKAKLLTPDLATLLQNYDHPHLGFASKNYYSEFLAMQWSLAYREQLFVNLPQRTKDYGIVGVYLTCQKLSWPQIKSLHPLMAELNNHIADTAQDLAPGTIIFSNQPLTLPSFMVVPDDIQRRFRPIRWEKALQKEQRWCRPAMATLEVSPAAI